MMLKVVLAASILNFASVAALWLLMLKRRFRRSELEILLDSIDLTRDHVDDQGEHTALEHSNMAKALDKANGRLQFIMAKDIADELSDLREATAIKEGDTV